VRCYALDPAGVVNSVPQTPWLNFLGEERKVKMEGKWKGGRKRRSGREKEGRKKEGDKGRGEEEEKGRNFVQCDFSWKNPDVQARERTALPIFAFFSLLKN